MRKIHIDKKRPLEEESIILKSLCSYQYFSFLSVENISVTQPSSQLKHPD